MIYEKTLGEKVVECLRSNPGKKFTAYEIAKWIFETYPDDREKKRSRSKRSLDDEGLVEQWESEIYSGRKGFEENCPQIKIIEDNPFKYYYLTRSDEDEVAQAEDGYDDADVTHASAPHSSRLKEEDLYPQLIQYLLDEHGVFSMRIVDRTSSNRRGRNGNLWLHPDVVGMEDLSAEWSSEVRDCVRDYPDRRASLWSFEVKRLLNPSNVRESFFQALSNSSWANFAYLVAPEIREDVMKELHMLSAAHGIGLIRLDVESPSKSKVLIPARERDAVDWDMVNRLAVENPDFRKFVERVTKFCQTKYPASAADWELRAAED